MGRYPWVTYSRALIEERVDWSRTKEGTAQEMKRKMRYLGEVVAALHERGEMSTTNPKKLNEKDIGSLFRHLKEERRLKPSTLRKYLTIVEQLTAFAGNPIVTMMRAHPVKRMKLPRGSGETGRRSFNLQTVTAFLDAARARAEASAEWWDTAAYGFAVLAVGFGLRPKEVRAVELQDLERFCWRLKVGYSKTEPDYATLLPPVQEHLERYLELRARALQQRDLEPAAGLLVPFLPTKGARISEGAAFTSNQVREMFVHIRKEVGVLIAPKDMRTSFGQILQDHGAVMDECSMKLRHKSSLTTQKFYVKMRPQDSFDKLKRLFPEDGKTEESNRPKKSLYRSDWDLDLYR